MLVFRCLWQNTDDQHHVTAADIIEYLELWGIRVKDYRTIQADIADLIDFGVDIVETRTRSYEYHIGSRHFDVPEVRLLVDAVQSSRFISQKKSMELIEKLSAFVGPSDRSIIHTQLYIGERFKANNEAVLRTVDAIQSAIVGNKKVTFQYFSYTPTKEKLARHGGALYVLSPYSLVWNGDNYYVIGYRETKGMLQTFRIDRIDKLTVLEEHWTPPPKDYNVGTVFSREFTMLSGKKAEVELLVENELMGNIIDHFGENVSTEIVNSAHFKVRTTVELSATFYGWLFASRGKIQLLYPQAAIDDFHSMLACYEK